MFVRNAAQDLDLGRTGTGAVHRSPDSSGQLEGRPQCWPPHGGRAHAYSRQDSDSDPDPGAGPGRCAQQVGGLQDSLGVLASLHAQGGHAGGAVALTAVGGQEGQTHGVGDAAGAQTVAWK